VEDLRRHDPLVRRGAPDAVHRMRVGVRRLRSTLATYRPLLDREATEPLREELKWLGRRLGEARDAEVLHERLLGLLDAEPPASVRGPVRRRVDDELSSGVRTSLGRAQDTLAEDRYFDLMDALQALAVSPPWTDQATRQVRKVLRGRVRHDWKRLQERVDRLVGGHGGVAVDERDAALHEVRKAAKRARYAAEPLVEVYGRPAERLVAALKRVQSVLGDHHDTQVARVELLGLDDRAATGDSGFTLGVLYAREEQRAERLEQRFERRWHQASRPRLRTWLD
jgi:CHAD domain-containing protein